MRFEDYSHGWISQKDARPLSFSKTKQKINSFFPPEDNKLPRRIFKMQSKNKNTSLKRPSMEK